MSVIPPQHVPFSDESDEGGRPLLSRPWYLALNAIAGDSKTPDPLDLSFACTPGQLGVWYRSVVKASGGTTPYVFSVASGAIPTGLSLDPSTGVISGTPSAAQLFSFTLRVTDAGGATKDFASTINIAMGSGASVPLTLSTVTGRDVGTPSDVIPDPSTRLVYMQVGVTSTWSATPNQQYGTIYLSKDGTSFYGVGWWPFTGSSEVTFTVVRPITAATWKVAMIAGTQPYNATAALSAATLTGMGAVISAGFAVAATPAPAESSAVISLTVTPGTGADPNFPYDILINGEHHWRIPTITLDHTGAFTDPHSYWVRITEQDYDASNNPIGPELPYAGCPVFEFTGPQVYDLMGPYGTQGPGYPRTGEIAKVGLRVYLINENDQTADSWKSAGSVLLTYIGTAGLTLVDVAKIVQDTAHGGKRAPIGYGDPVDRTRTGRGVQIDPRSGQLNTGNDSAGTTFLDNWSFETASAGVLGGAGNAPGWNWSLGYNGSIEILADGGNSGPQYARLTGADMALTQSRSVQAGQSLYCQVALRSSNTAGVGHAVGLYVLWLDASGNPVSPYTSIIGTTTGYVSAWTALGISGYVTVPAGAAQAIIKVATGAGEPIGGYWDVDDVFGQPITQQTSNGQTTSGVPASNGAGAYTIIKGQNGTAVAQFDLNQLNLLAADGTSTASVLNVSSGPGFFATGTRGSAQIDAGSSGVLNAEMKLFDSTNQNGILISIASAALQILQTIGGVQYSGYTGTVQAAYTANKTVKNGIICN